MLKYHRLKQSFQEKNESKKINLRYTEISWSLQHYGNELAPQSKSRQVTIKFYFTEVNFGIDVFLCLGEIVITN